MRPDRGRPARRHPSRSTGAASALVVAVLLAGCASPSDRVTDAIDQAVAATATAGLALDQDADGRTFRTTALTTAQDARREVVDAARSVAEVEATDATEAGRRAEALAVLDEAVRALDGAVDALGGVGDHSDAADRVADAEAALRALTREGRP